MTDLTSDREKACISALNLTAFFCAEGVDIYDVTRIEIKPDSAKFFRYVSSDDGAYVLDSYGNLVTWEEEVPISYTKGENV